MHVYAVINRQHSVFHFLCSSFELYGVVKVGVSLRSAESSRKLNLRVASIAHEAEGAIIADAVSSVMLSVVVI